MTLRQLEYLLAVVEEGSFTSAARRLLVSQPALSQQIKVLEAGVGGPLLERLPGTTRVTPLGAAFLPHAAATVKSAGEATRAARAVGRLEIGELWLATLQSIAIGIIPAAIQAWRHAHPLVNVQIQEFYHPDMLTEHIHHGEADVAVGPPPAAWEGPVRVLGIEELLIVLPVGDPDLPRRGRVIDLRRLADRPWVLYAPDFGLAPVVTDVCAQAGFAPRPAVRTHHTVTAVELAAAGLGPALVPANVIRPDYLACTARPDPPVERVLSAYTRAAPSPPVLAFIDILADRATLQDRVRPPPPPGSRDVGAP
jgi:DNA-binding transcriptional LysR family regulator